MVHEVTGRCLLVKTPTKAEIPYGTVEHEEVILPARVHNPDYIRGPIPKEMYVPDVFV